MKRNNFIIIFACSLLAIVFILLGIFGLTRINKSYNFTNKIMHYSDYIESNPYYDRVLVFLEDGTFYQFSPEYYQEEGLRSQIGTWKLDDKKLQITYKGEVSYDGGELVEASDKFIIGKEMKSYKYKFNKYDIDIFLDYDFTIEKGIKNDKYKNYLLVNGDIYYPIYEFETKEELFKKLEEMYGEVFTLLNQSK